jgi:catechol 2,3-dioxygenase-like lactoylglutathione lyase family enzyme
MRLRSHNVRFPPIADISGAAIVGVAWAKGADVRVKCFSWVGVSTDEFDRSLRLFRDVLGLEVWVQGEEQAILKTASGQQLEIFGRVDRDKQLTASPVVAFEVDDLEAAREELRVAGIELIGQVGRWNGFAWQYFRSPDGHIFELKSSAR